MPSWTRLPEIILDEPASKHVGILWAAYAPENHQGIGEGMFEKILHAMPLEEIEKLRGLDYVIEKAKYDIVSISAPEWAAIVFITIAAYGLVWCLLSPKYVKQCPACNRSVRKYATVCRHCDKKF